MRIIVSLIIIVCCIVSCAKTVNVDIPKFEQRLVVDGFIETNMPPVVLLSLSQDIYSTAHIGSFLSSFISDAQVSVSDGSNEYPLSLICSADLPIEIQNQIKGILGLSLDSTNTYNICAYTSINPSIWGQVGKKYTLKIIHQGQQYIAETSIVDPVLPEHIDIWWKEEKNNLGFGYSYLTLSDPPNQYDSYKWEVKRLKDVNDTTPADSYFRLPFGAIFDDNFFDGKTFVSSFDNPWTRWDNKLPDNHRGRYQYGDTAVIKISKMSKPTYDFLASKYSQLFSVGNPFSSYMNVSTNISNGALGAWVGYSPYFDTLICVPKVE